jgi:hypothetical protein
VSAVGQGILGLATFVFIWAALPVWLWWFQTHITDYMPESAKRRGQRYMIIGLIWLGMTIWLVWRYVLPDWWIAATPMVSNE